MDDKDVIMIERYIQENFWQPTTDQCDSYAKWAAYEILERFIFEAMKLPYHITGIEVRTAEEIVEDFIDEMDYYYYISSSEVGRMLFSAAKEEGKFVLYYIYAHRKEI